MMAKTLLKQILFSVLFSVLVLSVGILYGQSGPVYIKGGHYFDVVTQKMIANKGILIRGGRFYKVGEAPAGDEPDDYHIVELADDEYVLPGIVDIHAHYRMDAFGSDSLREIDEFKYNALVYFCLLYTSDAADDLLCVDLGGRR